MLWIINNVNILSSYHFSLSIERIHFAKNTKQWKRSNLTSLESELPNDPQKLKDLCVDLLITHHVLEERFKVIFRDYILLCLAMSYQEARYFRRRFVNSLKRSTSHSTRIDCSRYLYIPFAQSNRVLTVSPSILLASSGYSR